MSGLRLLGACVIVAFHCLVGLLGMVLLLCSMTKFQLSAVTDTVVVYAGLQLLKQNTK
jgi:hypothetical protein